MLSDPQQTQSYIHGLNIAGNGFLKLGNANDVVPVYVAPTAGVSDLEARIVSDTLISARFTADKDYQMTSVVMAPTGKPPLSYVLAPVTCKREDFQVQYEVTPANMARNTFGNGIAKNYLVVQVSLVSKCSTKVIVPLGGILIEPEWHEGGNYEKGPKTIAPYGLDHVMSVYNTDRTLTGSRAIIFNGIQAAATIGSAIEMFFGPGFTQGVAIFGGGFRNGVLEILKDMSPQQLKSLSSETFQTTETIGSNGAPPVQKFVFIPRRDVKLASGKRQRIDDISSLSITWFLASETTQTQNATNVKKKSS